MNLALKNFRQREEETELEFPSSLLSTERAYVHKLATELGLASKSRGKGQTRYLTVFKKEGSTLLELCGDLASPMTVQSYSHQLEVCILVGLMLG